MCNAPEENSKRKPCIQLVMVSSAHEENVCPQPFRSRGKWKETPVNTQKCSEEEHPSSRLLREDNACSEIHKAVSGGYECHQHSVLRERASRGKRRLREEEQHQANALMLSRAPSLCLITSLPLSFETKSSDRWNPCAAHTRSSAANSYRAVEKYHLLHPDCGVVPRLTEFSDPNATLQHLAVTKGDLASFCLKRRRLQRKMRPRTSPVDPTRNFVGLLAQQFGSQSSILVGA